MRHPAETSWTNGCVTVNVINLFSPNGRRSYSATAPIDFASLQEIGCHVANLRLLVGMPQPLRRPNLPVLLRQLSGASLPEDPTELPDRAHLLRCLPMLTEKTPAMVSLATCCDQLLKQVEGGFAWWADCAPWLPIPDNAVATLEHGLWSRVVITPEEWVEHVVHPNLTVHFASPELS